MPAKARPRSRRPRRRLKPGPILLVLLLANIAAGLAYSPMTSTVKVRVVGAPNWDHQRIQQILDQIQDRPMSKVNDARIESQVLSVGAVRSATLNRNLLGRGELRLTYRVPTAVLFRPNNVGLDKDGILFTLHEHVRGLPVLIPPDSTWQDEITLSGSWPKAAIADLCEKAQAVFPGQQIAVNASALDSVTLKGSADATVILGSTENVEQKLEVLRHILTAQPQLLDNVASVNVSSPTNPVTLPKPVRTP